MGKKVYYGQDDPTWASHPYNWPGGSGKTVKTSGCGPTCGSILLAGLGKTITPDKMCDRSVNAGYRVNGGTDWGFFSKYIPNTWGISVKTIGKSGSSIYDACRDGYYVIIATMGGDLWSSGGHFIIAVGAKDNNIQIFDPYLYSGKASYRKWSGKVTLSGKSAWVNKNTFTNSSSIGSCWGYKVGTDVTNADTTSSPGKSGDDGDGSEGGTIDISTIKIDGKLSRRDKTYAYVKALYDKGVFENNLTTEGSGDATGTTVTKSSGNGQYGAPFKGTFSIVCAYKTPGSWAAGYHTGVDFNCPTGTTLCAVADGTVANVNGEGSSYGQHLKIKHNDGKYSLYAHCKKVTVSSGAKVTKGQQIAISDNTGNSTGAHLHFEIRTGAGRL